MTATGFDPIAFLEDAVRVPSHESVDRMRAFLVDTLEAAAVVPSVDDAGNVLATRGAPAADADVHIVLNTHLDTVPPHVAFERDGGADPDVIRGRGSCDAKGPLAALVAAFLAVEPGDGARVTLAVTPDEETLSTGAHALAGAPDSPVRGADGVIVGEPTALDVCTAAKGRFEGTVAIGGASAHAAEPDAGENAVAALEAVLGALETFGDREAAPSAHPDLGPATLVPTVVEGGDATNQVPAACELTIDRRSVPPETADGFREALRGHLEDGAPDGVAVDFEFAERPTPFLEAWATDPDAAVVDALAAERGGRIRPFAAATEASYFAAHAPTVVFGPGALADEDGAVAHAPREYVRTDDVRAAADAVEATVRGLVG